MTTARSIVCDSCGADVPTRRLSCPACGDLLASVAGGSRRASVLHPVPSSGSENAADGATDDEPPTSTRAGKRTAPSILRDVSDDSSGEAPAADTQGAPDDGGLSALISGPASVWDAAASWDADPAPPGAWVPPRASVDDAHVPAGVAAPARSWAGHAGRTDASDEAPGNDAAAHVDAAAPSGHTGPAAGPASEERVERARLAEFIGWLTIAGGALSAVGFLLPWGASMIGATGTDYVSRWGIAGPFHLVVALAAVAIVVLAVVPNPVPAWIRVGIAGTMLAMFLLGLVWPYVFGLSSTGPGALAVAVGAVVLLGAGIVCLVTERHRAAGPAV